MFVLSSFLTALAPVLSTILSLYIWVILAEVVLSWVNADPWNPIVRTARQVAGFVLNPIRRVLPTVGMLDFSPFVAILALIFLRSFLSSLLYQLAARLR